VFTNGNERIILVQLLEKPKNCDLGETFMAFAVKKTLRKKNDSSPASGEAGQLRPWRNLCGLRG